ncbi:MAG: triose-phosphate isomerase [Proteobacteria bacterium]|nr:triose-phosphate isomerase [Pseudomonadota bacterium]
MKRTRRSFICGNWKMNKCQEDTYNFVHDLVKKIKQIPNLKEREIGIAPVFTSLFIADSLLKHSEIRLCAQNVHWEDSGQFTGEISAPMLKEFGVRYVIVGHSERRKFFGETNNAVNKRVKASIKNHLSVIMCVGETKEEREGGHTKDIVKQHVLEGLNGIAQDDILKYLVIAYEPVWAIGTGLNATVDQAVEVHKFIRELLNEHFGQGTGGTVRILYGGSVKPENIDGFMASEDIDGALVGGASLDIDSFLRIANFR